MNSENRLHLPSSGRNFHDTPEHLHASLPTGKDQEPDYTPDQPDTIIHYAPGDRPLCGDDSMTAVYSNDPHQVAGCDDCLELVAEDIKDHNDYLGRCLHCRQEITAQGGVQWRRVVRRPCPHCGKPGW